MLKVKNIINSGKSVIENLDSFELDIEGVKLTSSDSVLRLNSMVIFNFSWHN